MSDDDDEQARLNKFGAERMLPLMEHGYKVSLESAAAQSRWLLATLVLVNGGALVAVTPAALSVPLKLAGMALFVAGIFCALLSAHIGSQLMFKKVGEAFGAYYGYWLTVIDDGIRAPDLEAELDKDLAAAVGGKAAANLGWGSALSFLIGCALIGVAMAKA